MNSTSIQTQRRIAVLLPDLRPGGAERMHVDMARIWLDLGYVVDFVLLTRQGELLDVLPDKARVFDLQSRRILYSAYPLYQYLINNKPQALLIAMWPLTFLAPVVAFFARQKTRIIISEHAMLSMTQAGASTLKRAILRATTAIGYRLAHLRIGVSAAVAADMAHLAFVRPWKIQIIHNPAAGGRTPSTEQSVPEELNEISGKVILTVGKLIPVKDHAFLIEAFSRVKLTSGNAPTLCIVGDGPQRQELEALMNEMGLRGRVLLPGFREDVGSWYSRADLFVLSSRHEGFSNVIVEALEYGLPVVSTDCPGGPREILENGKYGSLVPLDDINAFCNAMMDALESNTKDISSAQLLKSRARDFSVKDIAEHYVRAIFPN